MTSATQTGHGDGLLTVYASIQEVPPDNQGGHRLASDEIRAEAASVEEGQEMLSRQVPDGWRVIAWRVDRP
ncbi:hypothetical protein [Nocardioides pakistanensis]